MSKCFCSCFYNWADLYLSADELPVIRGSKSALLPTEADLKTLIDCRGVFFDVVDQSQI